MFTPDTVQFESRDGTIIAGPFSCKYESVMQNSKNEDGGTTQVARCKIMVQDSLSGVGPGSYIKVTNGSRDLGDWMVDRIDPKHRKSGFHHNLVLGKLAE